MTGVCVRPACAGTGTPRHWLARSVFRPTSSFALAALLLAAVPAATSVGGHDGVSLAAGVPSPASSASPATSTGGDGLILFDISVPVGDGTYCSTFHTIRPDGSSERQLAGGCVPYGQANWSPAGDGIIIDSNPLSGTPQTYEVAADGGAQRPLLTLAGDYRPTFSPDGSQIACTADSDSIIIAAADGTHPQYLTSTPGGVFDFQPRFSPDGSRLVFTRIADDPRFRMGSGW